ncbi:endonuclease [Tanacetum coccineum]
MATNALKMAIFWDLENSNRFDIGEAAANIAKALIGDHIAKFCAYGNTNILSNDKRKCCKYAGIELIDEPSREPEAADKAIIILDMFQFAFDNPPPSIASPHLSCVMQTSHTGASEASLSLVLRCLRYRGFTVILATPSWINSLPTLNIVGAQFFVYGTISEMMMDQYRREYLKHDVIKLLKKYSGEMVFSGFEYCYKHEFKGEVNYDYYGLTNLEDLCLSLQ